MKIIINQIYYSPSDLTKFLNDQFSSWMDHFVFIDLRAIRFSSASKSKFSIILRKKGKHHENWLLKLFHQQQLKVVDLSSSVKYSDTVTAIKNGNDVIFQPILIKHQFRGRADFLIKVPEKSSLGYFCYEVWECKIGLTIKPDFLIQTTSYIEMLHKIQNKYPKNITIILGNGEKKQRVLKNYKFLYKYFKKQFLLYHNNFNQNKFPTPIRVNSNSQWQEYSAWLLKIIQHISQIAGIKKTQIESLKKKNILTLAELINFRINKVINISIKTTKQLIKQSSLQILTKTNEIPKYKFTSFDKNLVIPLESPGDLFFDIEGYPMHNKGLEYLWGVLYLKKPAIYNYFSFWAHTKDREIKAFSSFIGLAYYMRKISPEMHIYHYGNYELAVCKKIAIINSQLQRQFEYLLINNVFIDLFKIIKNNAIIGTSSYSIKDIEKLYRQKQRMGIYSASQSVEEFALWRVKNDGYNWKTSKILNLIKKYNIDDCKSTKELADWIRLKQKKTCNRSLLIDPKSANVKIKEENKLNSAICFKNKLSTLTSILRKYNFVIEEQVALTILNILEYYERENKPKYWRLIDRMSAQKKELYKDPDCIVNCKFISKRIAQNKSKFKKTIYKYSFDTRQEIEELYNQYFVFGDKSNTKKKLIVDILQNKSKINKGIIYLTTNQQLNKNITLLANEKIHLTPILNAIYNQVTAFENGTLCHSAIIQLLYKCSPLLAGYRYKESLFTSTINQSLIKPINLLKNLVNGSLIIQGPPGTGKTHIAKQLILELLRLRLKIGISSNSHKSINNLLFGTAILCKKIKINGSFIYTQATDLISNTLNAKKTTKSLIIKELNDYTVIGTTVWGFAEKNLTKRFDYLFIDEASQMSLPNLIAASQSAKNIILIGDQMQLNQPTQTCHPEKSGLSILDYCLHKIPIIPRSRGIFLNKTYRMHNSINHFISKTIYDGQLIIDLKNNFQQLDLSNKIKRYIQQKAGILPVPVMHRNNIRKSPEEIIYIVKLANNLLGQNFTTKNKTQKQINWKDILFLSPFNKQVSALKEKLGANALVGTIDKFQGQEAPIVFISMCSSNPNISCHEIEFLFNINRINVAISRTQCLTIVVYSPMLLEYCKNFHNQYKILNTFCRLIYDN